MEQEHLESFLDVAEELAVKGLAEQNLDTNAKTREKTKKKSTDKRGEGTLNGREGARDKSEANTKNQRLGDKLQEQTQDQTQTQSQDQTRGDKSQKQTQTQDQTRDLKTEPMQQDQISNEELENQQLENDEHWSNTGSGHPDKAPGREDISKTLKKEAHGYSCNLCGKKCSDLSKAKSHIEAKHFPSSTGYICSCCHQWFKTKNALSIHMSREHRNKQ